MKRIVFINGHCNDLLMTTMVYYLFKIKVPCKYFLLLKELASNKDVEVVNLVTEQGIYVKPAKLKLPFAKTIAKLESRRVLKRNGLSKLVKTTSDLKSIKDDDIVIGFVMSKFGCDHVNDIKGIKYLHLNQYYCFEWSYLNKIIPNFDHYLLEANVFDEGNYIFGTKLPENYKFQLLPFVVQDRFVVKVPFKERKNVALANGTIGPCKQNDYINFYHTDLIHKMRKVIYDNKDSLSEVMDVSITPYVEKAPKYVIQENDGMIKRLYKLFMNYTVHNTHGQAKYFSFNIVDKYNEYKMAVVPEEICGIPGIGAFEAMGCGCAFIGINHHMYSDLGLIPGTHYITYDGSLEDLKNVIQYYQGHQEELESIATAGEKYVHESFTKEKIANRFLRLIS